MSVLARDIDAYQRAVEQYKRQTAAYDNSLFNYEGKPVVVANSNNYLYTVNDDGTLVRLPNNAVYGGTNYNFRDLGTTPIEGESNFTALRQNPTSTSTETMTLTNPGIDVSTGYIRYYTTDADGTANYLPDGWYGVGDPVTDANGNMVYNLARNNYTFIDRPPDPTKKFSAMRPDPTAAQLRKLNQPNLAEQERTGLISSEIIKGGGVLGGGLSRAGKTTEPPPEPPPPTTFDPLPEDPGTVIVY